MKFLYIDIFYLAFIPLLIFIIILLRKDRFLSSVFDAKILKKLTIDNHSISKMSRNILLLLSLFFMIIALSSPVIENEDERVKKEGASIVLAIDVSKSMLAKDIYPNRLKASKKKAIDLAGISKNNQIGLISFSNYSFMLSPLSLDMDAISFLIHHLDTASVSGAGTNILSALQSANELLKDNTQKYLIIFSDGGDGSNFDEEILFANENNIKVSIVNIGTIQGSPIPSKKGFIRDASNNIVIVKRNDGIKELALETGGVFTTWSYDNSDIESILNHLEKNLEKKIFDEKVIKNYTQLFMYPLFLSILLLLIAFSSLPLRFFSKTALMLFFISLSNPQNLNAGLLDFIDIKQAQESYSTLDYNNSTNLYKKLSEEKKSQESYYNLANSYYKQKNYARALINYEKIKDTTEHNRASILHNMGNSYLKTNKLEKAQDSYEQSLELEDNEDTRYNLDVVQKMLQKQEEDKENKDKDDKENKEQNQDENEEKDGNNKDSKKQDEDKQDKKNKDKKEGQEGKEDKDKEKENKEDESKDKDKDGNKKDDKKKENKIDYDAEKKTDMKNGQSQEIQKRVFISKAEEKKWIEKINKQKTQVSPVYKFNFKGSPNAKSW